MTTLEGTRTGVRGLLPSSPERLPFAPSLHIRAFLLEREKGNLLIYSTAGWRATPRRSITPAASHGSTSTTGTRRCSRRSGSRRRCSCTSASAARSSVTRACARPSRAATCSTDTIYLDDGEWVAAVLGSSDRAGYLESLALLRELDFDVLVPWAASAGQPYLAHTDAADARRRIDALIDRVRAGGDR